MNLKRKDTPESREYWDYAERVTREVKAEILKSRTFVYCPKCGKPFHGSGGLCVKCWKDADASRGKTPVESDAAKERE